MSSIDVQAQETLLNRRKQLQRLFAKNAATDKLMNENTDSDWADRATDQEEAETLQKLTDSERRELNEIDDALARIAKGAYGTCEECGGPIGRQRLRAIPEARRCIACSEG